jgi:hypothetical protein
MEPRRTRKVFGIGAVQTVAPAHSGEGALNQVGVGEIDLM